MPIPALDTAGFLPEGIYDCSLDEMRERFGVFHVTDRRSRLFEKLQDLVHEIWQTKQVAEIIVDGSFVTAALHPNDIDLILVLSSSHDFSAELRPFEYNVLSTRQVRRLYGLDMLVAPQDSAACHEYQAFFTQVRGQPDRRKGLLRLQRDQE
jgi:hypothetical protein